MGLKGVVGTVTVIEHGNSLAAVIPSRVISDLLISRGDILLVRVQGKDIKYRKVE